MPSPTNAAATVDKAGTKTASDKVHEKVVEKRRALGRGLESLLPGPRVVAPPGLLWRLRRFLLLPRRRGRHAKVAMRWWQSRGSPRCRASAPPE